MDTASVTATFFFKDIDDYLANSMPFLLSAPDSQKLGFAVIPDLIRNPEVECEDEFRIMERNDQAL